MEEQIPLVGIIQDKQDAPLPLDEGGGLGWGWTKEPNNLNIIAKELRKRSEKMFP